MINRKLLVVIVGHDKNSPGATAYNGVSEYTFNSIVAEHMLKESKNFEIKVLKRDNGWTWVQDQVKQLNPFMTLELHFNAYKDVVHGCEVLLHTGFETMEHSALERRVADKLTDDFSEKYGFIERYSDGILFVKPGERGSYNLRVLKQNGCPISLLVEPCFANFKTEDSIKIIENPEGYAKFLIESLEKHVFYTDKPEDNYLIAKKKLGEAQKLLAEVRDLL